MDAPDNSHTSAIVASMALLVPSLTYSDDAQMYWPFGLRNAHWMKTLKVGKAEFTT
jgi:hypothetical protein